MVGFFIYLSLFAVLLPLLVVIIPLGVLIELFNNQDQNDQNDQNDHIRKCKREHPSNFKG